MTKPFVKYVGGKSKLLHEILPRLPKSIDTYYEPFVGGGAVFFALAEQQRFRSAVIGDTNKELVCAYVAVQTQPSLLIAALSAIESQPDWNTRERYNSMRSAKFTSVEDRAARFIYLNKLAFNGLWRVNKKGEFNVPFGSHKTSALFDQGKILQASRLLQNTVILPWDYRYTLDLPLKAGPKVADCCYFDPPYAPVSKTANFTEYSTEFGVAEQTKLAEVFKTLTHKGMSCVLSNSDTPLVRELYSGFRIDTVFARRSINSNGTKRGPVPEVLISGGCNA